MKNQVLEFTKRPRRLVQLYIASCHIKMDTTSWKYSGHYWLESFIVWLIKFAQLKISLLQVGLLNVLRGGRLCLQGQ